MDWISDEMPKLWRYNLHYFDYLLEPARSNTQKEHLISDWISNNPVGRGDAWEPYTTSLRIVNWIKYFLQIQPANGLRPESLTSLHKQARWLENNIEYHLLANHYLKNGKALFFAGVFFSGPDAERWLRLGQKILREEAREQILADGGHIERSPMYHSIVLEDYLDVLNLISSSEIQIDPAITEDLKAQTRSALDFLQDVILPDMEIPLFNDAAFGIAPTPEKLFDYARRVLGYTRNNASTNLTICAKERSGYYAMRKGDDMLVVDCGAIGPDYQPGHAHNDILSYELALDGRRTIVDAGVYDYQNSSERRYARSTKAHNTVTVDGLEQSEMWGVFRVARRAYPISASLQKYQESCAYFEGQHNGYMGLDDIVHKRSIEFDTIEGYTICDTLQGLGTHLMESYIHLHPDFSAKIRDNVIELLAEGEIISTITVEGANMRLERSWYFPEFGRRLENALIILSCQGTLPLQLSYQIKKIKG